MSITRDIDGSIARARRFVEARQRSDGLWHDFSTLLGGSTEWVTAFVGRSLQQIDPSLPCIGRAIGALSRMQRSNGGWSYAESIPTDCDSTAWAVQLLSHAPATIGRLERARTYIRSHQTAAGGFSTYTPQDRMKEFVDSSRPIASLRDWTSPHTCVTAVALQALLYAGIARERTAIKQAVTFLRSARASSGGWTSYWWRGLGYSTYHALKALSLARAIDDRDHQAALAPLQKNRQRDGGWAMSVGEPSTVFETALSLSALLLHPNLRLLRFAKRTAEWLVAAQLEDGSWPVTPMLRVAMPASRGGARGRLFVVADDARVFTTATALSALGVYSSMV